MCPRLSSAVPRLSRLLLWALAAVCAASAARAITGVGGERLAETIYLVGIALVCASLCLRSLLPDRAQAAWRVVAIATTLWLAGTAVTYVAGYRTTFSLAHVLLLPVSPLVCVGVVLYGRSAVARPVPADRWLDALVSALTVAAVGTAFAVRAAMDAGSDELVTIVAYPLVVVALAAVTVGLLALRGWALDSRCALLAAGATTFAVVDLLYRRAQVHGDVPAFGSLYDAGWLVGGLLLAASAWRKQRALPIVPRRTEIVVPIALGGVALVVLVVAGAMPDPPLLTIVLSGLAVAALLARMALSLSLNHRLLLRSRQEAITDAVTGLGNSRRLIADLEQLGDAGATLVLLDLNGFKAYNDTFGHLAGDELLRRIGHALARAAGSAGRAYRMGGDEFCVLLPDDATATPASLAAAAAQHGDGFSVTAAWGSVTIPDEATSATEALRIADERMYAHKRADDRASPLVEALLALIETRSPELLDDAHAIVRGRSPRTLGGRRLGERPLGERRRTAV